jgi:hypothetical protein
MHHEEIELNFEASCQQILSLESEILWEARSTPTLTKSIIDFFHQWGNIFPLFKKKYLKNVPKCGIPE